MARISICFLMVLAFSVSAFAQAPQEKYALVIGVKSYQFVQPLANSLNDAVDLSATLKKKGFHVIELYDPKTKREMQDAVRKYFGLLQGKNNVAGMVFYSGHGMQVDGINYLIPAQANPQIKADLEDQCLSMDYVMRAIEEAGNGLNIFVLDACRNNPFRGFSRSGEKGLSMVNAPRGSYIVYATKPGSVASDGTGRNGLFTSKLLKHINEDGLKFEEVFKRVAADVATESGDAQRPWISSDYTGDFFFSEGKGTAAVTKPVETKKETPKQPEPQNTNKTGGSILGKKDVQNNASNTSIAGVWQNSQFGTVLTLYLNEDGTGEFDGELMKYSVANGKITMKTDAGETNVYNMNLSGDQMTFSGGDLDQPLSFTKYSSGGSINQPDTRSMDPVANNNNTYGVDNNLLGVWSGNNETIEFKNNGQCLYLGQTYPYVAMNGVVSLSTVQGAVSFYYQVNNNQLILSANGNQVMYQRGAAQQQSSPTGNNGNNGQRNVPQELAGKWCWVNVNSTNSGGSSSDACITLNGNGTYTYYSERSMSVNTNAFNGGTNSQNSDQGQWWVQGDRIYYNSQTQGQGSYRLEKRNHPRNVNDPMIVLDGQPYVTQFQKAPWR